MPQYLRVPGIRSALGLGTAPVAGSVGDVSIVGNVDDTSALTLGSGASSVSGANTGDQVQSTLEVATEYTVTAPAAIPAGVNIIELNHATVAIEKTIATLVAHPGLMVIKNTSSGGTAAHTVTVTTGTFNGTHQVATLDAPGECLVVFIDSAGNGVVLVNVGTVGLA